MIGEAVSNASTPLAPRRAGRALARVAVALALAFAAAAPANAYGDNFAAGTSAYLRQAYPYSAHVLGRLAARGDGRAQTYLGFMYATGRGVPQDYREAARWMKRAAAQGVPDAQYLLGLMYDKGQGVEQDFVRAHAWLNLAVAAADSGHRADWALIRNAVGGKLTAEELATAQRLALEWRPTASRRRRDLD